MKRTQKPFFNLEAILNKNVVQILTNIAKYTNSHKNDWKIIFRN